MAEMNIEKVEQATMGSLKDFQVATVNRIYDLFRQNPHKRVLVADEVGMGKTLIARGAIVKTAKLRQKEGDDLFKVVYVCANLSIASQNIRKLNISEEDVNVDLEGDTRLSMQHLKIARQTYGDQDDSKFIQLIPLTPDTSFRMTRGCGIVNERVLMYAVFTRANYLKNYLPELEEMLIQDAPKGWWGWKPYYEDLVAQCEEDSNGVYPSSVIEKLRTFENGTLIDELKELLKLRKKGKADTSREYWFIPKLRFAFAKIGVDMLEPDLVIMDEFQRFKFLLDSEDDSEVGIIARRFLGGESTRILMLSATPYKLYSTLEEIDETGSDEHFSEFLQVMDFLLEQDQHDKEEFHQIWSNYSIALHELNEDTTAFLNLKKAAEDSMYQGICRTERISEMESEDYTDYDSAHHALSVSENDIRSYLAMGSLLEEIEANYSLPIDYVKSCPYLMSFMRDYQVKRDIQKYFEKNPKQVSKAKNNLIWLDLKKVDNYEELPPVNARLERLKSIAFENDAEFYLWIPPSKPYYDLQGVYKDSKHFSKILLFSAWEMVPRMIGTLLSYEADRRTLGKLSKNTGERVEPENLKYFAKRRYPQNRMRFRMGSDNNPFGGSFADKRVASMSLFSLIYPSETLADLYVPTEWMNQKTSLEEIEARLREQIQEQLDRLVSYINPASNREDDTWYYFAPMAMDGFVKVLKWLNEFEAEEEQLEESDKRQNKAVLAHVLRLKEIFDDFLDHKLGRMPDDLVDVLVNEALASPAVCAFRSNGRNAIRATELARVFLEVFNSPESAAIVQLAVDQHVSLDAHWKKVLQYCKDGCFQAMLDEYTYLLEEGQSFSTGDRKKAVHEQMVNNLTLRAATYDVDTYASFAKKVRGTEVKDKSRSRMRANFAVGFIESDGGNKAKDALRKDRIRDVFNSPLRPFVLATTSIGQEGLDFHNYCRRVMHWNLPSNPIDLEQREGRVNRYKCLAIRQNVADQFGDIHFEKDVWKEMFIAAKKANPDHTDLVPYWCFGKDQKVKIERIVPMYPMSKDELRYERLVKILSLYRLTLGQANQETLLEYLFKEFDDPSELKELFINLSPISKERG